MAKKQSTKSDVLMSLVRLPQTGRRPRKPKTVDARLDQLVKDSEAWVRLFREVWFDPSDPLIEDAIGASELPELPVQYDTAIDAIRWAAACAEVAEDKLKIGKRKAQKRLRDKQKE